MRQNCVEFLRATGALRLTKAATILPQRSSARPTTATSRHGRMQRQAALDLDRRDVLAAGDDHVVDAAGDEQVAVGIDDSRCRR